MSISAAPHSTSLFPSFEKGVARHPALSIVDLTTGYKQMPVLIDVTMTVAAGTIVCLIGPNGSGKSTLVRCAAGLLHPWSGAVWFGGQDVTGQPPDRLLRTGLATVLQGRTAFTKLSVRENLELGAFTLPRRVRRDAVEATLAQFPALQAKYNLLAGSLSGGEQQLVEIARALIVRPQVLIVDEPTLGLSPKNTAWLLATLVELNQRGQTILIVEQNAQRALEIAHTAYVLDQGRVWLTGPADEVMQNPEIRRAYVAVA